ncbi:CHAT domain-containing protein [Mycena vulgaris]|nr:CHAT domain-containing protein [Mycena vulgaris]
MELITGQDPMSHPSANKLVSYSGADTRDSPRELRVRSHSQWQQLIKRAVPGDSNLPEWHLELGQALRKRYKNLGNLEDLQRVLLNLQCSVDLTPEGHPERAGRLANLANCLAAQYERSGDLKDLEAILWNEQEAVDLTHKGTEHEQRSGDLKDIEAAVKSDQEAVVLTPKDRLYRAEHLENLAVSLTMRYRKARDSKDLEEALRHRQEAVNLTPEGHPSRAHRLSELGASFRMRYKEKGDLKDLEEAVKNGQEAVDLTPKDHPDRAEHLENLAVSLIMRYRKAGDPKDLDVLLQNDQQALDLTPEGHPFWADRLSNLAASFESRYKEKGDLKDLEDAVRNAQEAVDLTPKDHPERAKCLENLALSLTHRYRRLGTVTDLEAASRLGQDTTNMRPKGNPVRADQLDDLALFFKERFKKFGNIKDLEAAFQNAQQALSLTPEGHPGRIRILHRLGTIFSERYEVSGDLKDLEASLRKHQETLDLIPKSHPDRATHLRNLARALSSRYQRLRDPRDLDTSLQHNHEAVDLTPEGHPHRAGRLRNLAASFRARYSSSEDLEDLQTAVRLTEQAVDLSPEGHPARSRYLVALADYLRDQYLRLKNTEDLEAMNRHYSDSLKLVSSSPEALWWAALDWASLSKELQPSYCPTAYAAAFRLLPEILWMGHSISQRHDTIRRLDIEKITSTATQTCINLSHLAATVEIVEQGVATIFQQMLQLKTDVDGLDTHHAETFRKLSSDLYGGESSDPMQVATERNDLLHRIRKQPGLEHFLLPKPYSLLRRAAQEGPIIILNSHEDSCDGIIILSAEQGTPEPVPVAFPKSQKEGTISGFKTLSTQGPFHRLWAHIVSPMNPTIRGQPVAPRLKAYQERSTSKSTTEFFDDLLRWLWDCIVSPVYEALKSHDIHGGRLWWLPTGSFAGLPLHASPPNDQFIHSYTATLGSLVDAYAKKANTTQTSGIVGVTSTSATGRNFLPSVKREVESIVPIMTQPVKCLTDEHATVDAVKQQLLDSSWVHLACHGHQDLHEPTESKLLLYGGDLELDTILRMPLPHAQFTFLAACQTAMGDEGLANESFHLGGGFIAAGFRGAVGTLWSMHDPDGPVVAKEFYSQLFRNGRHPSASDAAEALHLAVKELRARGVPYQRWVPFTHMGI